MKYMRHSHYDKTFAVTFMIWTMNEKIKVGQTRSVQKPQELHKYYFYYNKSFILTSYKHNLVLIKTMEIKLQALTKKINKGQRKQISAETNIISIFQKSVAFKWYNNFKSHKNSPDFRQSGVLIKYIIINFPRLISTNQQPQPQLSPQTRQQQPPPTCFQLFSYSEMHLFDF